MKEKKESKSLLMLGGLALMLAGCGTKKFDIGSAGVVYDKATPNKVVLKFTETPELDTTKIALRVDREDNEGKVTGSVDEDTGEVTLTLPAGVSGDTVELLLSPGALTYGGRSYVKTVTFDNKAPEVTSVETSSGSAKELIVRFSESLTSKSFSSDEIEKFKIGDVTPESVSRESSTSLRLVFKIDVRTTDTLTVGADVVSDDVPRDQDSKVANDNLEAKNRKIVDKTLPILEDRDSGKEGVQSVEVGAKSLTVYFSEEMSNLEAKSGGKIEVFRGSTKLVLGDFNYGSLSPDGRSLEIEITRSDYLEGGQLRKGDSYFVKFLGDFLSGAVEDKAGNRLSAVTTEQVTVSGDDKAGPELSSDALKIEAGARTLKVTFSENVEQVDDRVALVWQEEGTTGFVEVSAVNYDISVTDEVLTLTIKGGATAYVVAGSLRDGDSYRLTFLEGAIKDLSGNGLEAGAKTGDVIVDAVPLLASGGDSLAVDAVARTFTVTFSEDIRGIGSVDLKTKVKLSGQVTIDGSTDASKIASATVTDGKLVVVLVDAVASGDYTVEVLEGAVEDTGGKAFVGGTTETDTVTVTPTDTTPPVLATTNAIVVDADAKTITVDFDETIATVDDTKITVSYDADGAGTTSVKAALTITTDYTIAEGGGDVVITLTKAGALTVGSVYSVAFVVDAVTDSDGNSNVAIADTAAPAVSDTTAPVLVTDALAVSKSGKTITVTFDEKITAVDEAMFTVKYDAEGVGTGAVEVTLTEGATSDGFTVAVVSDKVVITVTATLADDDFLTVAIGAEGVTDEDGNKNAEILDQTYTVLDTDTSFDEEGGLIGLVFAGEGEYIV